ncbi:MAG: mechanosensitive ion channel protein [Rickettsiales bacterium]|nr:mechanosensitive ion channel protein [Rickettsiales bacterium]
MDFNQEEIMLFLQEEGVDWAINIAAAVAIFILGRWLAKFLVGFTNKLLRRSKVDETLIGFLGNIVYALALTLVIIASLSKLGINTTSLAAVLAAAGLAIGLSLQGSLSNFAAGVMLISFRPFKKGDYVEAAGSAGTVDDISIFTTTLKTPDNRVLIVPNKNILDNNIINYSAMDTRRIDMVFGIGYDDDLKKAKTILMEELENDDRVLSDPAPVVVVGELADSSVNFLVRPWTKSEDYWATKWDLTERIKLRFDAEGISIPFPQRDLHVYQETITKEEKAA